MAIDATAVESAREVQLLFAGDAMMHQAQLDASLTETGGYDFSSCFAAVAEEVRAADYSVVNLEVPLSTPPYSGYPCFNAPAGWAEVLSKTGFDLLLTANNHTLDRRTSGLNRTIATLDSMHIKHIGTYTNAQQRAERLPMVADIAGFKVGFLNYTYGTNGFVEQSPAIVDRIERETMGRDIDATRRAGAEIVVVCIHWGDEYVLLPNASQKSTAEWLLSRGVDIIIGAHPHVVQPMQFATNKDGRRTLTVYSLGNLISNMKTTDTRGGAMVRVSLRRDDEGRAIVGDAAYRLVVVQPGAKGRPFEALPVDGDSLMTPATREYRNNFVRSARDVLNTYNKSVSEDTLRLSDKRRRRPTMPSPFNYFPTPRATVKDTIFNF